MTNVKATCPSCGIGYFVDEAKIPDDGGQLTCPGCSTKWTIFRPSAEPAPPSPDAAPPSKRRARSKSSKKVTCPQCGHNFVPTERGRAPVEKAERRLILLVEDQRYFTEVVREALGADYRTITVGTKDEALKVIEADAPSLMILDLKLARGQDGKDLLKAIPSKHFPVLIFTAKDESQIFEEWPELQRLGADDIVRKSMNVTEELRRKVADLLGG